MSNSEKDYFGKFTESIFGTSGSIPACGADTLRMMLLRGNNKIASPMKLQLSSIKTSLEFCNKLKNVANFVFMVSSLF